MRKNVYGDIWQSFNRAMPNKSGGKKKWKEHVMDTD